MAYIVIIPNITATDIGTPLPPLSSISYVWHVSLKSQLSIGHFRIYLDKIYSYWYLVRGRYSFYFHFSNIACNWQTINRPTNRPIDIHPGCETTAILALRKRVFFRCFVESLGTSEKVRCLIYNGMICEFKSFCTN